MNRDSSSLCPLPFIGLTSTTIGRTRVCCVSDIDLKRENGQELLLDQVDLLGAFQSSDQSRVRREMLQGIVPKDCANCLALENYATSPRQQAWTIWEEVAPDLLQDYIEEARQNGGAINRKPLFLDLRFRNKCNLECLSCNPDSSSRLEKRYAAIPKDSYLISDHRGVTKQNNAKDWFLKSTFEAELDELIHEDLSIISFAGGEPFLLDNYGRVLEKCIERKIQGQVEIRVVTNGSIYNEKMINLLSQFKSVYLTLSFDAHRAGNDYLRPPSNWNVQERNWLKFLKLGDNFHLLVNTVIQNLNIFDLVPLFYFIAKSDPQCRARLNPLYPSEKILDARILPESVIEEAARDLSDFYIHAKENKLFDEFSLSVIQDILGYITARPFTEREREQNFQLFLQSALQNDLLRGTHWREVFPKLSSLLNREQLHSGESTEI